MTDDLRKRMITVHDAGMSVAAAYQRGLEDGRDQCRRVHLVPVDESEDDYGVSPTPTSAPTGDATVRAAGDASREVRDARGYFEGFQPRECGEHRTVGDYRAWCHACGEWCYPSSPCVRCEIVALRAALDGTR